MIMWEVIQEMTSFMTVIKLVLWVSQSWKTALFKKREHVIKTGNDYEVSGKRDEVHGQTHIFRQNLKYTTDSHQNKTRSREYSRRAM